MDILDVMKLAYDRTTHLLRLVNTIATDDEEVAITVCEGLQDAPRGEEPAVTVAPASCARARSGTWEIGTAWRSTRVA